MVNFCFNWGTPSFGPAWNHSKLIFTRSFYNFLRTTFFSFSYNCQFHGLNMNYDIKISLISLNMAVKESKKGYLPAFNISKTALDGRPTFSFFILFIAQCTCSTSILPTAPTIWGAPAPTNIATYFQYLSIFPYVSSRFVFNHSHQSSPRHFHLWES